MNICAVIPSYNHSSELEKIITTLSSLSLKVIIVDDASSFEHAEILQHIAEQNNDIHLVVHKVNKGKGGAVITGLLEGERLGFTHALQIDADGQHNLADIDKLLDLAHQHPKALISGQPFYDETIPKSRLWGRQITHFWVHIETLSLQVKDTMCGFRVYPLNTSCKLINDTKLGHRMDFDIEIMVRLYWRNVAVKFLPTKVHYPADGQSHFKAFEDNLAITWLHTRLCFGMLIRLPKLCYMKLSS